MLSGKFGKAYREFTTDDAKTRYICLLNPRDLDMFVMVTTDTDGMIRVSDRWIPIYQLMFLGKPQLHFGRYTAIYQIPYLGYFFAVRILDANLSKFIQ